MIKDFIRWLFLISVNSSSSSTTSTTLMTTTTTASAATSVTPNTTSTNLTVAASSSGATTSTTSFSGRTFTPSDRFNIRLFKLCKKVCCSQMFQVFLWGSPKDDNISPDQYLLHNKGWSDQAIKKSFNKKELDKMKDDPRGDSYDITFLYKIIPRVCEKLAVAGCEIWITVDETLEYFLTQIKDFRNELMHEDTEYNETTFEAKVSKIQNILTKMLETAGKLYNIDQNIVNGYISDMNKSIESIRDDPLSEQDITNYRNDLIDKMKQDGKEELKKLYEKAGTTNVSPLTFIAGNNIHVEVGLVFTPLKLTDGSRDGGDKDIQFEDLLVSPQLQRLSGQVAEDLILVEGVAGSGKTTICKSIISQWCGKSSTSIKNVNMYDLIILMECRNSSISSLAQLLNSLMPRTSQEILEDDLLPAFRRQKALIIVDGLDELNESSRKLFTNILNFKRNTSIQIVTFSRPERIEDFYKMTQTDFRVTHIKVGEIPKSKREKFARNYHDELKSQGKSNGDTEELLEYMRTTDSRLHHLWGRPLFLVMLTVLWTIAPIKGKNILTATELYMEISKLTVEKLVERLKTSETTRHLSVSELNKRIRKFQYILSKVSLASLRDDNIVMSSESTNKLKCACDNLGLPEEEVIGTFLVLKNSWTNVSMFLSVSFPHKGMLDFFTALFLYHNIVGGSSKDIDEDAIEEIEEYLSQKEVSPNKIQKMIDIAREDEELILPDTETPPAATEIIKVSGVPKTFICVQDFLQKANKDIREVLTLIKYQESFVHLLGLLDMTTISISSETKKEIVRLIRMSGIRYTSQWLMVLNNTKCNSTISQYIAEDPFVMHDGHITIDDECIYGALILLKHIFPKWVKIDMKSDPTNIEGFEDLLISLKQQDCQVRLSISDANMQYYLNCMPFFLPSRVMINIDCDDPANLPGFENFLLQLARHKIPVKNLQLEGSYHRPKAAPVAFADTVVQVLNRCGVTWYHGRASWVLTNEQNMAPSLEGVRLSVLDEKDAEILNKFTSTRRKASDFHVHVTSEVPVSHLHPVLLSRDLSLALSGVSDQQVEWATQVVRKLQPIDSRWSYSPISIHGSQLSEAGLEAFIKRLYKDGIRLWELKVSSDRDLDLSSTTTQNLRILGCDIQFTVDDSKLWSR